ncbi:hypothetical protein Cfor_00126 [Coptotermes formosanus]|uniref:Uncharacterized protein n=1 Tax=Coptotermes formosanus TaxID=36987 RepID=A0A6L2Q880_COPFO|nr:hypothetical protein Cfor_00126 [Coptotermes formosanus]
MPCEIRVVLEQYEPKLSLAECCQRETPNRLRNPFRSFRDETQCLYVILSNLSKKKYRHEYRRNWGGGGARGETLVTLNLGDPRHDISARDKRTISFLRQVFPGLSQIIDNTIQSITRVLFRVIGRLVLRGGLLGGGGGGGGGGGNTSSSSGENNGRRITIVLPTYPPGEDDEEEEDNTEMAASEANPEAENQLAGAESQQNEVRVQYTEPDHPVEQAYGDQDGAASGGEHTTKRTIVAGTESLDLGLGLGASTSKSTTRISTNQTTTMTTNKSNGTARAVITTLTLIAGSSSTDSSDDGKSAEISAGGGAQAEKDDGYQTGIPGPITRLFIIANRGIANLMQDLILHSGKLDAVSVSDDGMDQFIIRKMGGCLVIAHKVKQVLYSHFPEAEDCDGGSSYMKLGKIVPRQVLASTTSSMRSDSLILSCVIWTLLNTSRYYNDFQRSKDE